MDDNTRRSRKHVSVNKWAYRKKKLKDAICLFSFSNFTFGFYPRSSTKVENNSIRFLNRHTEENFVVNNKDSRVFMSRNYRSDSCPLET